MKDYKIEVGIIIPGETDEDAKAEIKQMLDGCGLIQGFDYEITDVEAV